MFFHAPLPAEFAGTGVDGISGAVKISEDCETVRDGDACAYGRFGLVSPMRAAGQCIE